MNLRAQSTLSVAVFLVGAGVGAWAWSAWGITPVYIQNQLRVATYESGTLTNPLLECTDGPKELSIGDRARTESLVRVYTDTALRSGKITTIAVYFRDLNNGPWFGINERILFTPGSLLKLPLAMSIYHSAQWDSQVLDTEIEYLGHQGTIALESDFGSAIPLPKGVYTIRGLTERMLKESNNDAAEVLAQFEGIDAIQKIYKDFGILVPQSGFDYQIDVKTFGAFFRVLYNASYLSAPFSNELLTLLTQSSFDIGLERGVPATVLVAHKFGTRSTTGGDNQLHDCGIVYATKTPYVLCIMTQGQSFDEMTASVAAISKIVYEQVSAE